MGDGKKHKLGAVVHENCVTWLAKWKDSIVGSEREVLDDPDEVGREFVSLSYDRLTSLLWSVVRDQQTRIETLEQACAELVGLVSRQ